MWWVLHVKIILWAPLSSPGWTWCNTVAIVQILVQISTWPFILLDSDCNRFEWPNWIPQDPLGSNVILVLVLELIRTGSICNTRLNKRIWFVIQMMIRRKLSPGTNDLCRWKHEPTVLSNILSTVMMYFGNEYEKLTSKSPTKIVTYITQNFSFHHTCSYIQVRDRENTPNKEVSCMNYYVRRRKLL